MKIKNWSKFQHFKDRKPPWIKLYRELLDDMDWHMLDADAAKFLVMLWLIASEGSGDIPDARTLAFRLRMTEKQVKDCLSRLGHWLDCDDIDAISQRYQNNTAIDFSNSATVDLTSGETETETETDTPIPPTQASGADGRFERFWKAYPRKVGKDAAEKAFAKRKPSIQLLDEMLSAIEKQSISLEWTKDNGQYIPNPATWLNQGRWKDGEAELSNAMPDWMRGAI